MKPTTTTAERNEAARREYFLRLGSPLNLLSQLPAASDSFSAVSAHFAPPAQQQDFAFLSMNALFASLNFKPDIAKSPFGIFDLAAEGISEIEMEKMEGLYENLTVSRKRIADQTSATPLTESLTESLKYRRNPESSLTTLSSLADGRYNRYVANKYFSQSVGEESVSLNLNFCLEALDEPTLDRDIGLGELTRTAGFSGGSVTHNLRIYSTSRDRASSFKVSNAHEVDRVTALAAKKSFQAHQAGDEDKALEYAMVFGALRGHNIKSYIGACWAQELSMNWLLSHLELPLFRKNPGIYLDIEACCNTAEAFKTLIKQEVLEYKRSVGLETSSGTNELFNSHLPTSEAEYEAFKERVTALSRPVKATSAAATTLEKTTSLERK